MVTELTYSPLTRLNKSVQQWGRPLDPYGDGADVLAAIHEYLLKIVHASFLLDARRIEFGKSVVRARKGLLIGKAHAAARVCWQEPCST
jgi:hypothetical protein